MSLTERSSARDVAAYVAQALADGGIRSVLSGGGCASIYTLGVYQSVDLDFILQGRAPPREIDAAMERVGFQREENQYFHPFARFYVEFPPGPLSIGHDHQIEPIEITVYSRRLRLLSPTDSCRDRLAGYYHWNDRQGLKTALQIAARNDVDMNKIRRWSEQERATPRFETFIENLATIRKRRRK